ncbi:MAG TPA: fluoride efflux transporter CrcB [Thermomicrobiales bacterium]|nr:fluoride efflux transporter CrcB [Thermomicrobiales bacterium]
MQYLWVGVGGFVGANLRYILGRIISDRWGSSFPYGTFVINVTGAFVIGILMVILTERTVADPLWRQLTVVGFLGGYTTFSSYTWEAVQLFDDGRWGPGLGYLIGSNLLGLLACAAGMIIARNVTL